MRVLLDCRMASWSGIGRYTTGLARALAARDDVQLVQVCAGGASPEGDAGAGRVATATAGVETIAAWAPPFTLRGARELARIAGRVAPDLIHCPHFPAPLPVRRPLVVTLHDLTPLVMEGVMPSPFRRLVYRRLNARAAGKAAAVFVPSQATARDVAALFPRARGKIVVIPEAADEFSSGPFAPLTGRLAALAQPPYLLSMGNTKPHKDLPTLLQAFARVADREPHLHLLLVGRDDPAYLSSAARLPAETLARAAFTGAVGDAELRSLYAGAAAFVFPSRYEGFGLPVLEAMALGAPVVCAHAASLPEVAGDAALLYPAGDAAALAQALERLLSDARLRDSLVVAGRERAAQFAWARTAALTVGAYRRVLQQHPETTAGRERAERKAVS